MTDLAVLIFCLSFPASLGRLERVMDKLGGALEDGVYTEQFFTEKRFFEPALSFSSTP